MNGGELNYYFQGMYWKEAGYDKSVMLAAMFGWKGLNYGDTPSANDIFAACQGFQDTSTFFAELRDDAVSIVENWVGVPPGSTASVLSPLSSAGAIFGSALSLGPVLPR